MPRMIAKIEGLTSGNGTVPLGAEFDVDCAISAKRLADRGAAVYVDAPKAAEPKSGRKRPPLPSTRPTDDIVIDDPKPDDGGIDIENTGLLALPRHPNIDEDALSEAASALLAAGIEPTCDLLAPVIVVDSRTKLFGEIDSIIAERKTQG